MTCNDQFLADRVAIIEAQIVAYEAAVTALVENVVTQYTLDTGQSRQVVTRMDLMRLRNQLSALYDQRNMLKARLTGCNSFNGHPTF